MPDGYDVTRADLDQAVKDIDARREEQLATLRKLDAAVEETQSAWQGEAAGAYVGVMRKFDEITQKMMVGLNDMGVAVGGASTNYQIQEDEAGSQLGTIGKALG